MENSWCLFLIALLLLTILLRYGFKRHFNIELFHLLFQSNIFEVSILTKVHLPLLCLHWSKPICSPIFLPETKKPQKCCDSGKGYEIHPQVGENPFLNEMYNTNSHNLTCVGPNPFHD